jgi:cleavage and polyadenylation specificity factor subunit 1
MLPGGGISVQKVPLGVTVRQIQYISDTSISTPTHPLYAMLISKEVATDQSYLFDDGITAEVQAKLKEEKEKEKIKRQVEADLGGFDLEQEWVEEIEREDCFEIEKKYGGAPALETQKYEIWVSEHI